MSFSGLNTFSVIVLAHLSAIFIEHIQCTGNNSSTEVSINKSALIFKYYHRDHGNTSFVVNITDPKFPEDLRKVWKSNKDLKIITHGWISSEESEAVASLKDGYIETKDVNVLTLDWSSTASSKWYPMCALLTYEVGILAAEVLNKLVDLEFASYDRMHMIGHSLGAHVSGSTGAHCKQKMARITGLDPAGVGFNYMIRNETMRLEPTDAKFVDVIHTASGMAGASEPLGHADFYPNAGCSPQPGCFEFSFNIFESITSSVGCSHLRAYQFYIESIRNPTAFASLRCDTWDLFENGTCDKEVQYMGDPLSPSANGTYYLKTNDKSPYGIVEQLKKLISNATGTHSTSASPTACGSTSTPASPSTSTCTTTCAPPLTS